MVQIQTKLSKKRQLTGMTSTGWNDSL